MKDDQRTGLTLWQKVGIGLLIVLIVLLLGILFLGWLGEFVVFGTFGFATHSLINATGASPYLVKGILVLAMAPFFLALRSIGKIPLFKGVQELPKGVAWWIVIGYVSIYFLTMYFASREQYFDHLGTGTTAAKFYAITPEGVRFFDSPGIDPKYGIELQPVTPTLIANLERQKRGLVPKPLLFKSVADIEFFDRLTGEAAVWYYRNSDGELELFSSGGFHPGYGVELRRVTAEVVSEVQWQLNSTELEKVRQERQAKEADQRATEGRAKERAREQRAAMLEAYVNTALVNEAGRIEAALFIVGDGGAPRLLRDILATELRKRGVNPVDGLFRSRFAADDKVGALMSSDWKVVGTLDLGARVDAVVVGRVRVSDARSGEFEGLLTVSATAELQCLQVVRRETCGTRSIHVNGAGFSEGDAMATALRNTQSAASEFVSSLSL